MRLAIVGAGPIGLGTAMLAQSRGHDAIIWSPSGSIHPVKHAQMYVSGPVAGLFELKIENDIRVALDGASVAVLAVPANVHRQVIDTLVPYVRNDQIIVLWTQSCLSALYLSKLLAARSRTTPIAMWSGPLIGGRRVGERHLAVSTIRAGVDVAGLPLGIQDQVVSRCTDFFGPRFVGCRPRDIAFSNVNPVMHLPQLLCSLTQAEKGEQSSCLGNTTLTVSRLIDGLDTERRQVAAAFGARVTTLAEHFHRSFSGVPLTSVAEQAPILAARLLQDAPADGPRSLKTRFIDEDIPYGAVPTEMLGNIAGILTPLHSACINLFDILLERDLRDEYTIAQAIGLSHRPKAELLRMLEDGWSN
jgi:opine dehydrogenase